MSTNILLIEQKHAKCYVIVYCIYIHDTIQNSFPTFSNVGHYFKWIL